MNAMRIPFEALTHFLNGRPPEAKRTEPVAASADLGEAPQFSLRHWTPDEGHGGSNTPKPEPLPSEARAGDEKPLPATPREAPPPGLEERRKTDRRQQSIPVLLDTRTSLCRRKTDRQTGISLKA